MYFSRGMNFDENNIYYSPALKDFSYAAFRVNFHFFLC